MSHKTTYFDLFYQRVQILVDNYKSLLSVEEQEGLRNRDNVRKLFLKFPVIVGGIDGLMEAINEGDRKKRTHMLMDCLRLNKLMKKETIDRVWSRLQAIEETDRDTLAAGVAALFFISNTAEVDWTAVDDSDAFKIPKSSN